MSAIQVGVHPKGSLPSVCESLCGRTARGICSLLSGEHHRTFLLEKALGNP